MRCLSPPNGTWKIYCGLILSVVSYNTVFLMTSSNDIHKFICDTAGWSLSQSATKSYSHFNVCVPSLFNDSFTDAGWQRKIWFYSHTSRRAFLHIYYLKLLLFFISTFYDPHPLMAAYVCYGKAQGTMMTMWVRRWQWQRRE